MGRSGSAPGQETEKRREEGEGGLTARRRDSLAERRSISRA
jgi:hypothetical protein